MSDFLKHHPNLAATFAFVSAATAIGVIGGAELSVNAAVPGTTPLEQAASGLLCITGNTQERWRDERISAVCVRVKRQMQQQVWNGKVTKRTGESHVGT
jgi:hypothetical protein